MTHPPTFAECVASTSGARRSPPDMEVVRTLCIELLADVPQPERDGMLKRLKVLRRADDKWHLCTALFGVISRFHGENIARERIAKLNEVLA